MMLLTDNTLHEHLRAADAVAWIREALLLHAQGGLEAPPRTSATFPDGRITFTAGRSSSHWYGFRAYDTFSTPMNDQVVTAFEHITGRLAAIAVGSALGAMRTGTIGANAVRAMSSADSARPVRVSVIGAGTQAWAQLRALNAAMTIEHVRVHSRTRQRAEALVQRCQKELSLDAACVGTARCAVEDADVVILATSSPTPVIETRWLPADVSVVTLGPKQVGRHEFPQDLIAGAALVLTDSLAQLNAYIPPAVVTLAPRVSIEELGSYIEKGSTPPRGRRVFLSVGLSGTEVHLLGRLAQTLEH